MIQLNAALIILAAGRSLRMGTPKGLLDAGGMPLIEKQITEFRAGGGRDIVVVTAPDPEPYSALISARSAFRAINLMPELGQFSSLLVGIAAAQGLSSDDLGVFVLPVDVPPPRAATWQALLADRTKHAAIPVAPDGRGGHPVWLSAVFCKLLQSIAPTSPEARLDRQIRHLPLHCVANVRVMDPAIMIDLDTPEDYAAWRN